MRLIDAEKLKSHYSWWNNDNQKMFDTIVDLQPTVTIEPKPTILLEALKKIVDIEAAYKADKISDFEYEMIKHWLMEDK